MSIATGVRGVVVGSAGSSLAGAAQFGELGRVGAVGEQRTARLLAKMAMLPGGPTVIHDVKIPIPGFSANIDHVVVSGRDITLLDSKVWKAGFYWTLGGTRRGLEPVPHTDKLTLPTGVDAIGRMLEKQGVRAHFRRSVLVVWPGRDGQRSNFTFYRPQNTVTVQAADDDATLARLSRLTGTKTADPQIVAAISRILYR